MSLDRVITDKKRAWRLAGWPGDDDENIDTYSEFLKGIDTVIMAGIPITRSLRNFQRMNGFIKD